MARIWSSGAELQSVTSGVEFETVTGAGVSIDTTNVRSGAASLKFAPSATTALIRHTFQTDSNATVYFRFYLRIGTLPGATIPIFQYVDSGNGVGYSLRLSNAGVIQAFGDAGGNTLSSSSALSTGQWYRIETKITDSSGSTAALEWKIDGTIIGTHTSLGGNAGCGRLVLGAITGTTSPVLNFDDIAINNTTGTTQNSYAGEGSIVHLRPNAQGDNNGWTTAVGGTAGVANNFTRVNETTPNDATSYNQISTTGATGNFVDDFNTDSSATGGIGSSDSITLVALGIRGGSIATTTGATVRGRIKSAASGTVSTGAAQAFNINGWRTHNASPFVYLLTDYTDPTTGLAWTPTGTNSLDNMQIGYDNAASNTTTRRITTLWALVEYIPSVAPPASSTISGVSSIMGIGSITF